MAFKRANVFFSGMVQGVGFRFTASRLAGQAGLVGYVKNLHDGKVELMVQGKEEKISDLIYNLKENYFSEYVRDAEVQWLEPVGIYKDFSIVF
ncbi:MAG: acylphosphatase [Candidatus Aureabacteria bacterium]|nr:acylphosphatase [Candidatus Auribacterota bacterium]MCK5160844.1 acylphosphatase [Candidatus Auribacterota bacterium]